MGLPALPGARVLTVCVQAGGMGVTWTLSLVSVPGPVCLGGEGLAWEKPPLVSAQRAWGY